MNGIIDADTHISEGGDMWAMMDKAMYPRRPILMSVPEDTWYGNRNAFWLIDGEIYPKPAGKGSFNLVTPSAQKVQDGRKDSTIGSREMSDIQRRLADMNKLNTAAQVVYPTLFLVYNTKDVELEIALCRAYNRFLANACAQSQQRIRWTAVLPLHSLKECIEEIRFAKQNGAVGIFFRGIEDDKTLDHADLFPIYEEAQTANLSICVHTGCGVKEILEMVRRRPQSYIWPHARDAVASFPRHRRKQNPRTISAPAVRLYRSCCGLGAVSGSHSETLAERQVAALLERGFVP
jgi:uncharacterized protein